MVPEPDHQALANYIDLLLDAICVVDLHGRFVHVSVGAERVFGYTPEEMVGHSMLDFVHPDDRVRTRQQAAAIVAGTSGVNFENRYIRKDGTTVDIHWSARWSAEHGQRVGVARDITSRRSAEKRQAALYAISEAANSTEDLSELYERVRDIVDELLPAERLTVAVRDGRMGAVELTTVSRDGVQPSSPIATARQCELVLERGEPVLWTRRPDVDEPTLPDAIGVPLTVHGEVIGALVVEGAGYSVDERDLLAFVSTQVAAAVSRKTMLQRLTRLALHDALTDLPNRELFHDRVTHALARQRREQVGLALLYIDLDDFKVVNDERGHDVGDLVIKQAARRIRDAIRSSDTASRLGGDEFVVLVEGIANRAAAVTVGETLLDALNAPYIVDGERFKVSPSVGIAVCPEHGDDERQLLRGADLAMYTAKRGGGGALRVWDGDLDMWTLSQR